MTVGYLRDYTEDSRDYTTGDSRTPWGLYRTETAGYLRDWWRLLVTVRYLRDYTGDSRDYTTGDSRTPWGLYWTETAGSH